MHTCRLDQIESSTHGEMIHLCDVHLSTSCLLVSSIGSILLVSSLRCFIFRKVVCIIVWRLFWHLIYCINLAPSWIS